MTSYLGENAKQLGGKCKAMGRGDRTCYRGANYNEKILNKSREEKICSASGLRPDFDKKLMKKLEMRKRIL